jgi:hypothetical protein
MAKLNCLKAVTGKIQSLLRAGTAFTAALLLAVTFIGCAASSAGSHLVDHGFAFDVVSDSPGIDVLDYRYGQSNAPGARMPDWVKRDIGRSGGTNTNGTMLLGDSLYVKWRINATGEVLEQTVDLRNLLPRDMTNHKIYFVIKQRQLLIYVISPEKRPPDWPKYEPPGWTHRKVYVVYPTSNLDQ